MGRPRNEPEKKPHTIFLINDHYERMGCFNWDRTRFLRLCAAAGWTPDELGARVGITKQQVERALERSTFDKPVGILLAQHERFIRHLLTGHDDGCDLFPPMRLK